MSWVAHSRRTPSEPKIGVVWEQWGQVKRDIFWIMPMICEVGSGVSMG